MADDEQSQLWYYYIQSAKTRKKPRIYAEILVKMFKARASSRAARPIEDAVPCNDADYATNNKLYTGTVGPLLVLEYGPFVS